jgi:hypothetical protein
MNLIWKIKPVLTGIIISGLFFSCTGGPESSVQDTGEDVAIGTDEPAKGDVYESKLVDEYKLSKESYFLDDGSANGYKEYTYNSEGFLTGIVNYRGSGELLFEEEYTLDAEGQIIKSELSDSEGITSYTLFEYDGKGQLVVEEYYNHRDVFLSGSRYEYDNKGRKILWESLDENKSLVLKSEYIYKGNDLIKVAFLTPLNKDDGSLDYFYTGNKVVKEISINGTGKEERRTEYEYDNDMIAKEKIFQLGRLSRINEITYDDHSNKKTMVTYNRSQKVISQTEYEYVPFQVEKNVLVK